ncbi:MAG: pyridoxamine kinase [Eubacteriales bacterium]
MQKRAATIQDISCFGRCSLTVALPILSAAGITACGIPSAVLSTHTGGFEGYTFRDLTDDIAPIAEHWKSLDLTFDAIYTGYLGSVQQINLVADFIDSFRTEKTVVVVDPAMADFGRLYRGFGDDFPAHMASLCAKADVIVPNLTEAALLLGKEYVEHGYTAQYIEELVRGLAHLGAKKVVLTGVSLSPDTLGAACYDSEADKMEYVSTEKIGGFYHGTGDVFASALVAALANGKALCDAALLAAQLTVDSIRLTVADGTDNRFGVNFEQALPAFMQRLGIIE